MSYFFRTKNKIMPMIAKAPIPPAPNPELIPFNDKPLATTVPGTIDSACPGINGFLVALAKSAELGNDIFYVRRGST